MAELRARGCAQGSLVVASATSQAWRPIGHRGRSRASLVRSEPAATDDQPSWIRRASPRPWLQLGLHRQTKRLSDPLKLQIVGCSWQSGGER